MKLTKNGREIVLTNPILIRAYEGSGWVPAKEPSEPPKEEERPRRQPRR